MQINPAHLKMSPTQSSLNSISGNLSLCHSFLLHFQPAFATFFISWNMGSVKRLITCSSASPNLTKITFEQPYGQVRLLHGSLRFLVGCLDALTCGPRQNSSAATLTVYLFIYRLYSFIAISILSLNFRADS